MIHSRRWSWLLVSPILLMVGCTVNVGDESLDNVNVTIQARYEKRNLSDTGFGSKTTYPTRYAFAEIWTSDPNNTPNGFLAADGTRTFSIPRGSSFQVALYTNVEIPNNPSDTGFFFYGGVKKATPAATYTDAAAFNNIATWRTTSEPLVANTSGTVQVTALEQTNEAGAFAITDQLVSFALGLRQLEPTLRPPELYAFWDANTKTTYPKVAWTPANVLRQPTNFGGRVIFHHGVRFAGYGTSSVGADAYNDSVLQEAFARLLFADHSLQSKGNSNEEYPDAIIRRDSDNVLVNFVDSSEASIAWTNGFSTFLSCAFRNDPTFREIPISGSPSAPNLFRLDRHDGFTPTGGGEFYAGSIARTLWGIWKNPQVFNGTSSGLQTIWNATVPANVSNPYEYGKTPLTCYPTYLNGLARLAGAPALTALSSELSLENVGNGTNPLSSGYLNSNALWITPASVPFAQSGAFPTNQAALGYFDDRDTSQAYRFVQVSSGPRTITLSTTSVGLQVELFNTSYGLVDFALASSTGNGIINIASLPAGTYVARVRLNPTLTYANGTAPFSLSVN